MRTTTYLKQVLIGAITLFDMGFFYFVVIAPMIMKFGTGIKPDVFYTMVTKSCDDTTIT